MKSNIAALISGLLFGIGLAISGMTRPGKVQGYLDIFGDWDLSLVFVMAGAIAFNIIAFRLVLKRANPLFAEKFHIPTRKDITWPLVLGSAAFGIGWGLGGYCPGPGIVSIASFDERALTFAGALVVGIWMRFLQNKITTRNTSV